MSDWKPIETAPKDGTDVLLCAVDADGSYWAAVAQWWVKRWVIIGVVDDPTFLTFEPQFWMPLPTPPQEPSNV